MPATDALPALYTDHLATLDQRLGAALERHGYDSLLVSAGTPHDFFQDDQQMPFRSNPWFRWWLPLGAVADSAGCQLLLRPGQRPQLVYQQPEDFWHLPPAPPSGAWTASVDLHVVPDQEQADKALAGLLQDAGRLAHFSESGDLPANVAAELNPQALRTELDWYRGVKSAYEVACLAEASRLGARAHLAARDAFFRGESEYGILQAYLGAIQARDADLPYNAIVALNEHAAVLHYQYLDRAVPEQPRTFLIDAGASARGYGSDITRTWTTDTSAFAGLLAAMETHQLALCDEARPGLPFADLHASCHRRIGSILQDAGLVAMDPDEQIDSGVTRHFLPHGLGHHLGLQTHDVGGHQCDREGSVLPPPERFPKLRTTRPLAAGQVLTIEPGLYFIPMLLRDLRQTAMADKVDWAAIDALVPYGGIRIEDNVVVAAEGAPRNLTREAFTAEGAEGV